MRIFGRWSIHNNGKARLHGLLRVRSEITNTHSLSLDGDNASLEEKGRLIEMSATSNEKCESLKGILEENGVEISTTVMANVSKNLLFNRLKSKINAYFTVF